MRGQIEAKSATASARHALENGRAELDELESQLLGSLFDGDGGTEQAGTGDWDHLLRERHDVLALVGRASADCAPAATRYKKSLSFFGKGAHRRGARPVANSPHFSTTLRLISVVCARRKARRVPPRLRSAGRIAYSASQQPAVDRAVGMTRGFKSRWHF